MTATPRIGAVITAGGRSSRLGAVGQVIPKGLLPLTAPPDGEAPQTAIGRLVEGLRAGGVADIVVAANDHPWFDRVATAHGVTKIVVPPTGEWDAAHLGYRALPACDTVAVVSSDNVFPGQGLQDFLRAPAVDHPLVATAWRAAIRRYTEVTSAHVRAGGAATGDPVLCAAERPLPLRRIVGLVEKPDRDGGGLAKAGAYRFPATVLDDMAARAAAVSVDRFGERSMTEALLRILATGPLLAFDLPASFVDIGTPEGLDQAIAAVAAESRRPGLVTS